jgi:hypothetical protein
VEADEVRLGLFDQGHGSFQRKSNRRESWASLQLARIHPRELKVEHLNMELGMGFF